MDNSSFLINYCGRGISFYLPNPQDHIQKQILNTKNFYEIDLLEEIGRFPLSEGIICDIGANIGNHSLYFAALLNRQVYAFEPTKEAIEIFKNNIDLNGLNASIKVFQMALGSEKGLGRMEINASNLGASYLQVLGDGDVSINRLDDVLEANLPVALLKIDVEGFEKAVLTGAERTIQKYHPLIVAETHTHRDFLDIYDVISPLGYLPIGQKGATNTVFFVHQSMHESVSLLGIYLQRLDTQNTSNRIRRQLDQISKSIESQSLLLQNQKVEREIELDKLLADNALLNSEKVEREIELDKLLTDNASLDDRIQLLNTQLKEARKKLPAVEEKIKSQLSYRIGNAIVRNSNIGGFWKIPLEIGKAYSTFKESKITTILSNDSKNDKQQIHAVQLPSADRIKIKRIVHMQRPKGDRHAVSFVYDGQPLISVIMTTYNIEKYVEAAIRSIMNQTWKNLELIVVDDCSSDNTRDIITRLANEDPRIKVLCYGENRGTYWCKNYGIVHSSGDIVTFMDSDDTSEPKRLEMQFEALNRLGCAVSTCNHVRKDEKGNVIAINGITERIAYISQMIRRSVIDDIGYFDSVRTSADDEMFRRIKLVYGDEAHKNVKKVLYIALLRDGSLTSDPENAINFVQQRDTNQSFLAPTRKHYARLVTRWHDELASQGLQPYVPFPVVCRPFPVFGKLIIDNELYDKNTITVCLATFPARQEILKQVVDSLLPQVDRIFIYLNQYDYVPDFLKSSKIVAQIGEKDLRDNGKFFFMNQIKDGYVFTVDDDIVYPKNYIQTLIQKIELYERKVIVGLHGTIFEPSLKSYFKGRTLYHFEEELLKDKIVNQLGTGTVGFHTSLWKPSLDVFQTTGMADLWLAIEAKKQNIPMLSIQRHTNWLLPIPLPENAPQPLFREYKRDDKKQTEIMRKNTPWGLEINESLRHNLLSKSQQYGVAFADNIIEIQA